MPFWKSTLPVKEIDGGAEQHEADAAVVGRSSFDSSSHAQLIDGSTRQLWSKNSVQYDLQYCATVPVANRQSSQCMVIVSDQQCWKVRDRDGLRVY